MNLIKLYVSLVLALWVRPPLERLYGAQLKGPMIVDARSLAGAWAGRTTLASGTAFATISTQIVNSDSLIMYGFQVGSSALVGVNSGAYMVVSSVVSGISFALGYSDAAGRAPGGTFMWEIRRTS